MMQRGTFDNVRDPSFESLIAHYFGSQVLTATPFKKNSSCALCSFSDTEGFVNRFSLNEQSSIRKEHMTNFLISRNVTSRSI